MSPCSPSMRMRMAEPTLIYSLANETSTPKNIKNSDNLFKKISKVRQRLVKGRSLLLKKWKSNILLGPHREPILKAALFLALPQKIKAKNAFQNSMSWARSTNSHRDVLKANGMVQGQFYASVVWDIRLTNQWLPVTI